MMFRNKKNTASLLILFFLFLLLGTFVLAIPSSPPAANLGGFAQGLEVEYPDLPGIPPLSEKPTLPEYLRYIYVFSIIIAGLVAFASLVYGGFRYLTSVGQPLAMAAGREQITAGIIGLMILLSSYLILATINPQLIILKEVEHDLEEVPEVIIPPIPPAERKDLAFQIPLGKIIEEAVLSGEAESQLRELNEVTQEIINLTGGLDSQLFELKALIDACNCGISQCSADCQPQSCQINCDIDAIRSKASEIKNSPILPNLGQKEQEVAGLRSKISEKLLNLYKAVFLTTIFYDEVRDYFTFVIERDSVAQSLNREIEIETLPEWGDISIYIQTPDGRIIADPATFYFWRTYEEMQKAINFAQNLSSEYLPTYPGINLPPNIICVPSQPGTFIMPAQGAITQKFGVKNPIYATGFHNGIDIANNLGTPIVAAAKGEVVAINNTCPRTCGEDISCGGGYGNWILIKHSDLGINTLYAHLDEVLVKPGDEVNQGQQIGTMGCTGLIDPPDERGTHLHFAVIHGEAIVVGDTIDPFANSWIDPLGYITGENICGPGGGGGGGRCEVITDPDNPCSVDNLLPYFGVKASEASQICNAESGGNIWNLNDGCFRDQYDYSVGLFQINLYRTGRCDAIGIPESEIFIEISPSTCQWANPITSPIKAGQCAEAYGLGNAEVNINWAVQISGGGSNWCPWTTAHPQYCNLCPNP